MPSSAPELPCALSRTARLAERARDARRGGPAVAVLNAGISGNRLLSEFVGPSGLDRFERDVLDQSGVTHAIILIGINDIGFGPSNAPGPRGGQLGAGRRGGHRRASDRGLATPHRHGTRAPRQGAAGHAAADQGQSVYWSPENEAISAESVNRWIREQSHGRHRDALVDFDRRAARSARSAVAEAGLRPGRPLASTRRRPRGDGRGSRPPQHLQRLAVRRRIVTDAGMALHTRLRRWPRPVHMAPPG